MTDCIFCKIIGRQIPSQKIYETENVLVFLDAFPITTGHSLVVPKKHFERFDLMPADAIPQFVEVLHFAAPKIAHAVHADGFNLGLNNGDAAGQIINHVHWHVIPRYHNDGLRHWPNTATSADELSKTAELIKRDW